MVLLIGNKLHAQIFIYYLQAVYYRDASHTNKSCNETLKKKSPCKTSLEGPFLLLFFYLFNDKPLCGLCDLIRYPYKIYARLLSRDIKCFAKSAVSFFNTYNLTQHIDDFNFGKRFC